MMSFVIRPFILSVINSQNLISFNYPQSIFKRYVSNQPELVYVLCVQLKIVLNMLYSALPETPSRGGQIPEMIQVCDYDILIVPGELNTLI